MESRPQRTIAQLVVAVCVVGLLAAGVWLAVGPGRESTAAPAFPVSALVPDGVEVILSTSWPELRDSALLRAGLFELPEVVEAQTILRALRGTHRPLDWTSDPLRRLLPGFEDFSFRRDVFAGEIVVAGQLRDHGAATGGLPRFAEFLLLTRISPDLARALASAQLTTEHAQARLAPEVTLTDLGEGVMQLEFRVQSRTRAGTWAPGLVVPHSQSWYVLRVDDVVAFGNSERLLCQTAALAASISEHGGWPASFELASASRRGELTACLALEPLREYLREALGEAGVPVALLRHWLRTSTFNALELHVGGTEPHGLLAEADLHYEPGRLTPEIRSAYGLWPRSFEEAATLVPAEDTFALVALRSPPELVLDALLGEFLTAADRKSWSDGFHRMGSTQHVAQVRDQVRSALGETWTFALARTSNALDPVADAGFPSAGPERPIWALLVSLSDEADAELLAENLNALLAAMGIPTQPARYLEHTLHLPHPGPTHIDSWWLASAWLVTEEHLILASDESYARRVVDTLVNPDAVPPLTTDPLWRETTIPLPDKVLVGVYVDLQRLFRVLPSSAPGSQPRGSPGDRQKPAVHGRLRGLGITIHADAQILHGNAYLGVTPPTAR